VRRASIVLVSACAFALLMLLGSESAAAAEGKSQGVSLASSKSIKSRVDAAERRRVMHSLTALKFGPGAAFIAPEELNTELGPNLIDTPASPENQLDEVEVETRVLPGVHEQPLQSQVPFGLAGIVWGFRHPNEAWRLFLPVLAETGHAQPGAYAATRKGRASAGAFNPAVSLP
jgi:hypothetical protein